MPFPSAARRRCGALLLIATLAGCGAHLSLPDLDHAEATPPAVAESGTRAFQVQGQARWDGQPSLGTGVWVAYAEGDRTWRVRIRNLSTGEVATGMLYPREAGVEGAPFTLSAVAADALGIPAATPTEVRVTALREIPAGGDGGSTASSREARPVARPAAGAS